MRHWERESPASPYWERLRALHCVCIWMEREREWGDAYILSNLSPFEALLFFFSQLFFHSHQSVSMMMMMMPWGGSIIDTGHKKGGERETPIKAIHFLSLFYANPCAYKRKGSHWRFVYKHTHQAPFPHLAPLFNWFFFFWRLMNGLWADWGWARVEPGPGQFFFLQCNSAATIQNQGWIKHHGWGWWWWFKHTRGDNHHDDGWLRGRSHDGWLPRATFLPQPFFVLLSSSLPPSDPRREKELQFLVQDHSDTDTKGDHLAGVEEVIF